MYPLSMRRADILTRCPSLEKLAVTCHRTAWTFAVSIPWKPSNGSVVTVSVTLTSCSWTFASASPLRAEGIAAVARLFPRGSATQVIYVTGYGDCHSKVYATQHVGFLMKPVVQKAVDEAVGEALRRRAESSERPVLVASGGDVRVVLPRNVDVGGEPPPIVMHPHPLR